MDGDVWDVTEHGVPHELSIVPAGLELRRGEQARSLPWAGILGISFPASFNTSIRESSDGETVLGFASSNEQRRFRARLKESNLEGIQTEGEMLPDQAGLGSPSATSTEPSKIEGVAQMGASSTETEKIAIGVFAAGAVLTAIGLFKFFVSGVYQSEIPLYGAILILGAGLCWAGNKMYGASRNKENKRGQG